MAVETRDIPSGPWRDAARTLADARRRVRAADPPDRRSPPLRLVGHPDAAAAAAATPATAPPAQPPAIVDPVDPRWVLAVRTSDVLQGSVLPPERRESLLRLGRTLGLTPFESNLVLAIVQDQARRGIRPELLAASAEPQLRMVPISRLDRARMSPWRITAMVAALLAVEVAAIWMWLN